MQLVKYKLETIRETLRILNDIASDSKSYIEEPLYLITALGDINQYLQTGDVEDTAKPEQGNNMESEKLAGDEKSAEETCMVGEV